MELSQSLKSPKKVTKIAEVKVEVRARIGAKTEAYQAQKVRKQTKNRISQLWLNKQKSGFHLFKSSNKLVLDLLEKFSKPNCSELNKYLL